MKLATNKTNKRMSFPAAAISFGPGETKTVTDDVAVKLSGNTFIAITSMSRPSQPIQKVAVVERKVETVNTEESTHTAKRSKKIIRDNESDE